MSFTLSQLPTGFQGQKWVFVFLFTCVHIAAPYHNFAIRTHHFLRPSRWRRLRWWGRGWQQQWRRVSALRAHRQGRRGLRRYCKPQALSRLWLPAKREHAEDLATENCTLTWINTQIFKSSYGRKWFWGAQWGRHSNCNLATYLGSNLGAQLLLPPPLSPHPFDSKSMLYYPQSQPRDRKLLPWL